MAGFEDPRLTLTFEQFRLLKDMVEQQAGLLLREDLKFVVERRLLPRIEALGLSGFAAYERFLRFDARGKEELELALEVLLPHETYFFRDPSQLECFKSELCPMLLSSHAEKRRLRLWSAGCSTGEEPYTLAMVLDETGLFAGWDIEIHGTDISRRVVAAARKATYSSSSLRATSYERRQRFFEPMTGGNVTVRAPMRARVSFGQVNLVAPGAADVVPLMDVIFCRNVLIYFDVESRKKALAAMYSRLQPGGWLVLGHSESLLTLSTQFEVVQLEGDLLYRRGAA
jgi:chemotaxis protein methyltransferase CheR